MIGLHTTRRPEAGASYAHRCTCNGLSIWAADPHLQGTQVAQHDRGVAAHARLRHRFVARSRRLDDPRRRRKSHEGCHACAIGQPPMRQRIRSGEQHRGARDGLPRFVFDRNAQLIASRQHQRHRARLCAQHQLRRGTRTPRCLSENPDTPSGQSRKVHATVGVRALGCSEVVAFASGPKHSHGRSDHAGRTLGDGSRVTGGGSTRRVSAVGARRGQIRPLHHLHHQSRVTVSGLLGKWGRVRCHFRSDQLHVEQADYETAAGERRQCGNHPVDSPARVHCPDHNAPLTRPLPDGGIAL